MATDPTKTDLTNVIEFREFSRRAAKLLTPEEREALVMQIHLEREAWPVIEGSGGLRKARFGFGGRVRRLPNVPDRDIREERKVRPERG